MGLKEEAWKSRLAERTDLSTSITHLIRAENNPNYEEEKPTLVKVLLKILAEKTIAPSTTKSGFIVGSQPAVCFQDAPLVGISQNVFYEQKYRKSNPHAKLRYNGAGLLFSKPYAFKKGARPVIYEKTTVAKGFLPSTEHWRIVGLDLENIENFTDWTHEREWRHPGAFTFEIESTAVLLPNSQLYKSFIKECKKQELDYPERLQAVMNMGAILY